MSGLLIATNNPGKQREYEQLLAQLNPTCADSEALLGEFTPERAAAIKAKQFDVDGITAQALPYEQLDQRLFDILMGIQD